VFTLSYKMERFSQSTIFPSTFEFAHFIDDFSLPPVCRYAQTAIPP
jgi:hypothetical protein